MTRNGRDGKSYSLKRPGSGTRPIKRMVYLASEGHTEVDYYSMNVFKNLRWIYGRLSISRTVISMIP
jgi:hypothetical protein